jgi:hypothetical protein
MKIAFSVMSFFASFVFFAVFGCLVFELCQLTGARGWGWWIKIGSTVCVALGGGISFLVLGLTFLGTKTDS